jgi:hypothetical protein
MDQQVAQLLSSAPLALANPGQSVALTKLYPTTDEAKLDVVPVKATYGRTRISSNSLSLASSSQFQIPPQSIVSTIMLCASVAYNRYVFASSLWLLDAIASISYQISGMSTVAQVQISGDTHKDMIMCAMSGKYKRDQFFANSYINGNAAGGTATMAVPLFLPFSGPQDDAYWSLDSSTLRSNIIITIQWKAGYQIFNGISGQSPTIPSAFSSLYLSCEMEDITVSPFKVSQALQANPSDSYNIPFKYCQTYSVPTSVTPGTPFSVALSALPAGQLIGVVVSARPQASYGVAAATSLINPEGLIWSYCRLMHNGEVLVQWDSEQEKFAYQNYFSEDGGGYQYTIQNMASYSSATATSWLGESLYLPLNHSPDKVLTEPYTQACLNYGGSVLNFDGTIRALGGDAATNNPSGTYVLTFTYIFNSMFQIDSRGTVSMIL